MNGDDGYSISPEDFLEVLGMTKAEVKICNDRSIFTIRQLAYADSDFIWDLDSNRFNGFLSASREVVANYAHMPVSKKSKINPIVWGYTYISPALHDQIHRDQAFKTPYELFQTYAENPQSYTRTQPWKSIYYEHVEAAASRMTKLEPPSDTDVFAYLIWRGHGSVNKCDVTASARAIPFLVQWLPGHVHGSCMAVDKLNSHDLGNPHVAERYAYPVAINLTSLYENHKAKIYAVRNFTQNQKLDLYHWEEMARVNDILSIWGDDTFDNFNPGQNIFDTVPHGSVVLPSGEIPIDCMKIYPRVEPVEKVISF